ncbi:hypothetical protein B0F90DRAFT_1765755 [Multifurca ochricompacta]|uniref:Uncharacterized protein n=1 Tax=Multifurca ochricompacta TaxID=376703 RepID=A0AAD4QK14_9AGAM|nr:hypothetical protein B0F90DRAFT_1765755 [Multifurca ochricompacta]
MAWKEKKWKGNVIVQEWVIIMGYRAGIRNTWGHILLKSPLVLARLAFSLVSLVQPVILVSTVTLVLSIVMPLRLISKEGGCPCPSLYHLHLCLINLELACFILISCILR